MGNTVLAFSLGGMGRLPSSLLVDPPKLTVRSVASAQTPRPRGNPRSAVPETGQERTPSSYLRALGFPPPDSGPFPTLARAHEPHSPRL